MDKPHYPFEPIGSIDKLARTLGVSPAVMEAISNRIDESYSEYELPPHPKTGKVRTVFEAKHELKRIQKRINSRIFEAIEYPTYLQGGIKATPKRDYVENANMHVGANSLISLDIKNFYPNIKASQVFNIFKQLFNFPDALAKMLTKLTTYKGTVPQGGCTSTYLANLVFFNSEYHLVSAFRGQGIVYSRLLDDVVLSSPKVLSNSECTDAIQKVVGMFKKYEFRLNSSKTKVEFRGKSNSEFNVTGLWIEHSKPKIRKKERRYIRQLVFNCELKYIQSKDSDDYHIFWNKTSGLVAKLERLKHPQAKKYRERLKQILPIYDDVNVRKIIKLTNKALKVPKEEHSRYGRIQNCNRILYRLGILGRSEPKLAKNLRRKLKSHYATIPTKKEYWFGTA